MTGILFRVSPLRIPLEKNLVIAENSFYDNGNNEISATFGHYNGRQWALGEETGVDERFWTRERCANGARGSGILRSARDTISYSLCFFD